MTRKEHALLRTSEHNRIANETRADHSKQRKFELGMLSYEKIVADIGAESADISDGGRGARAMTRQIDRPTLQARRFACMKRASAQLPRSCGIARTLLWAIFRNGPNRRETIGELRIGRRTYWWGLKFLLKFFHVQ